MPEKRIELGRAAPEGDERFERWPAAPAREHLVAKAAAHDGREHAGLLEQAERVGGEHFRPLVAVVPRGITARKDMPEGVDRAVVGRTWRDRNFPTNGIP